MDEAYAARRRYLALQRRGGRRLTFKLLDTHLVAYSVKINQLRPLLLLIRHCFLDTPVFVHNFGLIHLGHLLEKLLPPLSVLIFELIALGANLSLDPDIVLYLF